MESKTILGPATGTVAGSSVPVSHGGRLSFQATETGDGAVTGTVVIQGSNDGLNWVDVLTLTLSGTDSDVAGGQEPDWAWVWLRANLTSISGTDASVTVTMGS